VKALKIPLLILSALLLFSCWVALSTTRQCSGWIACLDAMEDASLSENWPSAADALDTLSRRWERWQVPLHILIPHDELDNAEMLLSQCRLHCAQKDTASLCNAVSQLRCQYEVLAETEQFSLKNVL